MGPPGLQFTFLARPVSFNTKAPHDVRDEEEPGGMLPDWTHPYTVGDRNVMDMVVVFGCRCDVCGSLMGTIVTTYRPRRRGIISHGIW